MRALSPALPLLLAALLPGQGISWEIPHRGAITYKRTPLAQETRIPEGRLRTVELIPTAEAGGHEWRYLACEPQQAPENFQATNFDDSNWLIGRSEFGNEAHPHRRTNWQGKLLLLRSRIDLDRRRPKAVILRMDHDDGVRVYVNGELVLANDGYGRDREYVIAGKALDAFTTRENVIAVRCDNIGGAQYLDLSMSLLRSMPPGIKTAEALQQELRSQRDAARAVTRNLFSSFRTPGMLLQGELDPSQEHAMTPPVDLRDFAWWVATDLQRGVMGGAWTLQAPRINSLGDVILKCRSEPVDATGYQTVTAKVEAIEPELRGEDKRFVRRYVLPHVHYGLTGEIQIRRRVEMHGDKARVSSFRADLICSITSKQDRRTPIAEFEHSESWAIDQVFHGQDAEFRLLVADVLERSKQSLLERLAKPNEGNLRSEEANANRTYHTGRLALGLLALLKSGVDADQEVIQNGFAQLRKRRVYDTYSLGTALMAMDALYAPKSENADIRQGLIRKPAKRQLADADLALVKKWTEQLLQNTDSRVDRSYLLRFNYEPGGRYDHSVNQYGLLGLYAAHMCGVEISPGLWEAAANHLIDDVGQRGDRLDLELVDFKTLAMMERGMGEDLSATRMPVRPMGWNYESAEHDGLLQPFWGAMTCAGITGLAICQAGLMQHPDVRRPRLQSEASQVRSAAFGWLAQNMTVRHHPGWIQKQHAHIYYYLYGLERAALLSGVALIQDRDWYFEGSLLLGQLVGENGQWPGDRGGEQGIERDAMAMLFLSQSTAPVLTGN
jgi:hypothetical protein